MAKTTDRPWDGSASRFTDEEWERSCILDRGTGNTPKERYALPVREPDGTINIRALHAARAVLHGARGGVRAPAAAKAAAERKLDRLYREAGLETAKAEYRLELAKADPELRVVWGVALEPDLPDSQGDVITADEIRKAAWNFMEAGVLNPDVNHDLSPRPGAHLVESWVPDADTTIGGRLVRKGSWVVAYRIHDDALWQAIRKGELTGFSIYGVGVREE
jgi:hypothetical protein